MTNYSPASSLGWLDFDAAAADRVATLLNGLREPRTLDVLGMGSVAGAFSQMLHPGTSYVHTKLRYLMFLPWIFRRIERDEVAPGDFFRRLRDDEARLIDCLRHLGRNQGVIGHRAGRKLRRMPSSIYWSALRDWGLRRLDVSMGEYAQHAAAFGRYQAGRDDDGNATDTIPAMWAALPSPPKGFLDADISFELRRQEARTLADGIRRTHPDTLLAVLCDRPETAAACAYPWNVPGNDLPGEVAEVVRQARCFSELTLGPQYTYNILVARRARHELDWDTKRLEETQLGRLERWVEMVESRRGELHSWAKNLPTFWTMLGGNRIDQRTRAFIADIAHQAVEKPEAFKSDPTVHNAIRLREFDLKGKRARLVGRSALENWNQRATGGQLKYRWSIAKNYLAEIATASRAGA